MISQKVKDFLKEEDGLVAVEYAVLMSCCCDYGAVCYACYISL